MSLNILLRSFVVFGIFVFYSLIAPISARADDALILHTGAISYSLGGFDTISGFNTTNGSIQWEHSIGLRTAVITGYDVSYNMILKRILNQNVVLGLRMFQRYSAWPISKSGDFGDMTVTSHHRWHTTVGVGLGRYLLAVLGEYAALEASSEYLAPFAAFGYDYRFLENSAVGVVFIPRIILGFGAVSLKGYDLALQLVLTQKL